MLALLFLLLVQCTPQKALPPSLKNVHLVATDDVNGRSPIAVDVVMTSTLDAAKKLSGLSARDYFLQKRQLLRDYPNQILMAQWELVPGQTLLETLPDSAGVAIQTFVFADYNTPGEHRLLLPSLETVNIFLKKDEFETNDKTYAAQFA